MSNNTGKGWHGDTPGHKAASRKKKLISTLRTGLKKDKYTVVTKADIKDLAHARILGISAFLNRQSSAPAQDKLFMAFLSKHSGKVGTATPYLKAFTDGWHYMNAKDLESTNHRQLAEDELYRMIDMWAFAPLTYKPEIDNGLMILGLARFWDDTPDAVENTDREIYGENGWVLEEWYDFETTKEKPAEKDTEYFWWNLEANMFDDDKEVDDNDLEHIAGMIEEGYTEGEILSGEHNDRGYWKITFNDASPNEHALSRIGEQIKEGNTSGQNWN